jgi:hypothetical protein
MMPSLDHDILRSQICLVVNAEEAEGCRIVTRRVPPGVKGAMPEAISLVFFL